MAVDGVILLKFYGVGFETLNINENESVIDPQITEIQVLINFGLPQLLFIPRQKVVVYFVNGKHFDAFF